MVRSKVDLPHPDGPSRAQSSFDITSNVMSSIAQIVLPFFRTRSFANACDDRMILSRVCAVL
jgi:hypothetical protein